MRNHGETNLAEDSVTSTAEDDASDIQWSEQKLPEGVFSLLDTDLYKLTMQCAVHRFLPDVHVTYAFTNRTPHMKLTREAYHWLEVQISKLENITLTELELKYLKTTCPYFNESYLEFLSSFHLQPSKHVQSSWIACNDTGSAEDVGETNLHVGGLWLETILYEIPLLALTSEAYFKFCDKDWDYEGQKAKAYDKGLELIKGGCVFSEFGTRRRRDYHTQELVMQGLKSAQLDVKHAHQEGWKGRLSGTSNVHFAMRYALKPIGTVAHEWFMGIASITNYEHANETALRYWVGCFGEGVLGIALTDTFGTPTFLKAFRQTMPTSARAKTDAATTRIPVATSMPGSESETTTDGIMNKDKERSYAQIFEGVRQDSGSPVEFVKLMRDFYNSEGITDKKTIVFSDSLNTELCLEYKRAAVEAGFQPTFGIGTYFTNDFLHKSDGKKSVPLNIVIKLSSANGSPAIKISDNVGKNTGDMKTVNEVKERLGYQEKEWVNGDETTRWGPGDQEATHAVVQA